MNDDEVNLLEEEEKYTSESAEEQTKTSSTVSIGIIGDIDDPLTVGTKVLLTHKNTIISVSEDIDEIVEQQNDVVVFTEEVKMLDNDTLDESRLLSACRKVETHTEGSFCIRSSISPDTVSKIVSCGVSEEWWEKKIVYWPEMSYNLSVEKMFTAPIVIGGQREATQGFYNFLEFQSNVMNLEFGRVSSMLDTTFVKLAVSGFYGVVQTYANQFADVMSEYDGSNYNLARQIVSKVIDDFDKTLLIPCSLRSREVEQINLKRSRSYKGEYGNKDIRIFSSLSDRIPVLDECVNYRNVKG